jgi:hypothetical protein
MIWTPLDWRMEKMLANMEWPTSGERPKKRILAKRHRGPSFPVPWQNNGADEDEQVHPPK